MQIKNYPNVSVTQIRQMVGQGAKFVIFPYTISVILMTLKRSSEIYFINSGENSIKHSYPYVLLNFFIGWWGFPWGPIYTIGAIFNQIQGGKDVTALVMSELIQNDPEQNTTTYAINNQNNLNNQNNSNQNNTTYGINNQTSHNSNSEYNIPN